ncbi:glycosyltransferase family 1 protein [Mucilaginibacter sp.]|uniref:glycosyltransferase family 1 protein n=1 Tax=Mucilaginibacter sp. TaxID=1882438 RepID=UPI003AFF86B3
MKKLPANLLCLSHLRWDFVYQRPQHLLTRFSEIFNTYFLEEPMHDAKDDAYLDISKRLPNLWVVVPHIQSGLSKAEEKLVMKQLMDNFMENEDGEDFLFWYYTPMALSFTEQLNPGLIVYDCMDELSLFKNAPAELKDLEKRLMAKSDVVFTGGQSLYEAKKHQHANIHAFPSSIDRKHFIKARTNKVQPEDQKNISNPKLGFYGVIDERFDIELIGKIANARPTWQFMLIGPVVKINRDHLPKNPNIHYLGQKNYEQLPQYLSVWDVALIPFVLNDSTKFISPTKTPEYLSAGKPVVSTAIRDVVNPYGKNKLVHIGATAEDFIEAIEYELANKNDKKWLAKVDAFLSENSWDNTCANMITCIQNSIKDKQKISIAS